jgi:peroxiredoxin
VGVLAPDFVLTTTNGETVRLSDKRGRIAVFMFVAMTCPPARTQVDLWKGMYEKYDVNDVEVFFVYSRERHAGERGYPEFKETKTTSERMVYARMLSKITAVPVVVDPIDEPTLKDYGVVPNAAFVVDREGFIVFKSQWADIRKIERVVEQLLISEELKKQTKVSSG